MSRAVESTVHCSRCSKKTKVLLAIVSRAPSRALEGDLEFPAPERQERRMDYLAGGLGSRSLWLVSVNVVPSSSMALDNGLARDVSKVRMWG